MLFILRLLAAALAAMLLASNASAQDGVRWGMMQAEVEAMAPDIESVRRGERLGDKQVRSRGHQRLGALNLEARYFYDDAGLAMIQLHGPPRECRTIVEALVGAHGNPLRVSDQAILRLIIWHDDASDRRIRLMVSAGICDVHYERLTDYREHDLASAPN